MPKEAKERSRHGLNALMARVKVRGLKAIDGRTVAAQSLLRWKRELLRDLGGPESISAQKMAVVEMAVRTRLFLDHVDAFLLSQSSLIDRRRKAMLPILRERAQLADSLSRQLAMLGLDRVERDAGSIPPEWLTKLTPHREEEQDDQAPAGGAAAAGSETPEAE